MGIWLIEFGFCGLPMRSYWCRGCRILGCLWWVGLEVGFGVLNLVCDALDVGG